MVLESVLVVTVGSTIIISTAGAYKFLHKKVKKIKDKYLQKKYNLFLDDIEYQEAKPIHIDVSNFNNDIDELESTF